MLRVTPPAGWEPPEPIKNSGSFDSSSQVDIPSPENSDPFGGDFDDIETILSKPQQPGQAATKPTRSAAEPARPTDRPKRKKKRPVQTQPTGVVPVPTGVVPVPTGVVPVPDVPPVAGNDSQDDGPMLPNDQWQSDETRNRKRWVSRLMALFALLMVLGAIAVGYILNLPKPEEEIAKKEKTDVGNVQGQDEEKKVVNIRNNDDQLDNPLNNPLDPNAEDEDVGPIDQRPFDGGKEARVPRPQGIGNNPAPNGPRQVEFRVGEEDDNGHAANIPRDNLPPVINNPMGNDPPVIPGDANLNQPNGQEPNAQAPNGIGNRNNQRPRNPRIDAPAREENPAFPKPVIPGGISPLIPPPLPDFTGERPRQAPPVGQRNAPPVGQLGVGNQPADVNIDPEPPKKKSGVGSLDKVNSKIGDLAGLLERNGTSLTKLRDIADGLEDAPVGMAKYVFEKPSELKPNPAKLKLSIAGMLYDKATLPQVARDFTNLSGLPVTIDVQTLVDAGIDPNTKVSATIKNSLLDAALDGIIEPFGLVAKLSNESSLLITVAGPNDFVTKKTPLPNSAKLDDRGKQLFLAYIKGMISPEIWVQAENPATVKIEGGNIVATCPPSSQFKIKRLVAKLASSISLSADDSDKAAQAMLQTRSGSLLPKLKKEIVVRHSIRLPIGAYFNKLQKDTGVSVIVDWQNVALEGWTPETFVPGNIDEPTVQEVIQQLARSMGLDVIAVNQDTILLTTTKQANSSFDIEVYSVAKLLDGKFDEDSLKEIFESALGSTLRNSRYIYDSNCRCFIVAAPQSKQRQVEALIERLKGI